VSGRCVVLVDCGACGRWVPRDAATLHEGSIGDLWWCCPACEDAGDDDGGWDDEGEGTDGR
jgi:hypothetical protein